MSGIVLVSPFLTASLARDSAAIRSEIEKTSKEMSSLQSFDLGERLRGDYTQTAAMDTAISRIEAYKNIAKQSSIYAGGVQAVLSKIESDVVALSKKIIETSGSGLENITAATLAAGGEVLESIIGGLSTQIGGRFIFSGNSYDAAPLPGADEILLAIQADLTGVASLEDFNDAIDAWFASPTGFSSIYRGGGSFSEVKIGESISIDVSAVAIDSRLSETIKSVTKIALINQGMFSDTWGDKSEVVLDAAQKILSSSTDRSDFAAQFGAAQAKIEQESFRQNAELVSIKIAKSAISEVDMYEASVKIINLESQLKTIYEMTGRLSNLRLTDYLR